jgi:hypothetical protein
MIEIESVVPCKSKEKENLEKFKKLQNATYLSNETITKSQKDRNKPCRYGEGCKLKGISCKYIHPSATAAATAPIDIPKRIRELLG